MRHHEPWRELLVHREASEHGLREHPERQRQRQPREIAPERPAREREHRRDHGHDADEPGHHAIAELDQRVIRSGGSALPSHFGQFGQPSPDPVRRTAAPVSTINDSEASVM